jgi:hypothetical protein
MIEVLIVFIVILIINDELMVDIYSSCKPSVVISFHSFAIQLIQVPLVAISHRMARPVLPLASIDMYRPLPLNCTK